VTRPEAGASAWAALHGLRIGCVRYLNSKPLIYGYDGDLLLEHPSVLAREFAAGRLDAALVPVFEILRDPHYSIVDDVAIACDGPVYSVILAYRGELKAIQRVALDPASMSSANLIRVLLAEFHGIHPEMGKAADAQLIIGNQAIEFREQHAADASLHVLDLGEEWKRCTGLPFVFAAWAVRSDLPNLPAVADAFRELKANGLSHLDEVIREDSTGTPEFRRRYLTKHIQFDLREPEKEGLKKYRELLYRHRLIECNEQPLRFA
jgi:predicted solute-binding protein